MKDNQLNRGKERRLMYVENKSGDIDGVAARVGWVTFSKSGMSVYYRGRELNRIKGGGSSGNHRDALTGDQYWISGVKVRGSNTHYAETTKFEIDEDALEAYKLIKSGNAV
jgi:hypothetical protein